MFVMDSESSITVIYIMFKQIPRPESASELYRPSYRRFSVVSANFCG
jgi:hypothetical protein